MLFYKLIVFESLHFFLFRILQSPVFNFCLHNSLCLVFSFTSTFNLQVSHIFLFSTTCNYFLLYAVFLCGIINIFKNLSSSLHFRIFDFLNFFFTRVFIFLLLSLHFIIFQRKKSHIFLAIFFLKLLVFLQYHILEVRNYVNFFLTIYVKIN